MGRNNNVISNNMKKRAALNSTVRRSSKKTKRGIISTIESLPPDMLTEVLARVGAASFTDVFNAKLSYKFFNEVAEDTHIYRQVSLDPFPLVAWKPLNEKQRAFLARCQECQNPEIMYRQAVIDYFGGKELMSGLRCLQKAANLRHIGAMYTACIVLLFSGDNESIEIGVRMLARMKKRMHLRRELKVHRDRLINMLQSIWIENPLLRHRPVCCTREDNHKRKIGWSDEEEDVYCEACCADSEIRIFSGIFHQQ